MKTKLFLISILFVSCGIDKEEAKREICNCYEDAYIYSPYGSSEEKEKHRALYWKCEEKKDSILKKFIPSTKEREVMKMEFEKCKQQQRINHPDPTMEF